MRVVLAGCGLVVRRSVTALRLSTSIPIGSGHDRGIGFEALAAGRAARDTPALVLVIPGSGSRIRSRRRSRPGPGQGGGGRPLLAGRRAVDPRAAGINGL